MLATGHVREEEAMITSTSDPRSAALHKGRRGREILLQRVRATALRMGHRVFQTLLNRFLRISLRMRCRWLQTLLNGYRSTALLYLAAKLDLADLLASGPRSSADLAQSLGAHLPSLHRVLRGLVTLGVCSEKEDGRFGLTALGTCLQSERPGSVRGSAILCGEEWVAAWGALLHSVMTGETAFNHVFGMSQWDHRVQHPELNECFNARTRESTAQAMSAILAAYDFSPFCTIADVGGGHGALLAAILQAYPSATGILFDQPHVVAEGRPYLEAAGVTARCRVDGGNFFECVPDGADAHILKSVIHDWDDGQSLAILRNCHRALKRQGRLLLIERVMPIRAEHTPEMIMGDLHMLAVTGGQERSEFEYRALFASAGFKLTRVIPTYSWLSIIEGIPTEQKEET
jgi:SAM-dependent methyltransferase